ncbi:MAG: hypothetical protein R3F61_05925 [Myxococcota bacterium]
MSGPGSGPTRFVAALVFAAALGCGSGLPELRPASFESPDEVEEFGRIRLEWFRHWNGPSTIRYAMVYADGTWIRIPHGAAEAVSVCEAPGVEAIALRVHGEPHIAGTYVLQMIDDEPHLERLCAFGFHFPEWEGTRIECTWGETWDAAVGNRVHPTPPEPLKPAE